MMYIVVEDRFVRSQDTKQGNSNSHTTTKITHLIFIESMSFHWNPRYPSLEASGTYTWENNEKNGYDAPEQQEIK